MHINTFQQKKKLKVSYFESHTQSDIQQDHSLSFKNFLQKG